MPEIPIIGKPKHLKGICPVEHAERLFLVNPRSAQECACMTCGTCFVVPFLVEYNVALFKKEEEDKKKQDPMAGDPAGRG